MKAFGMLFGLVCLLSTPQIVLGEMVDMINRRLADEQVHYVSTTSGKLSPLQVPAFQAPAKQMQMQAPFKSDMALQAPLQVPSKASASLVLRPNRACTLIPGRARRVARRAERATAAEASLAVRGRTLLEATPRTMLEASACSGSACSQGRTLLETSACNGSSCSSGGTGFTLSRGQAYPENNGGSAMPNVHLTSLTTRELLEGGSIATQGRIVQEPGICGGGSCSGGGRGLFRRR